MMDRHRSATDAELVRRIRWEPTPEGRQSLTLEEWLVTNGLGGYATGTVSGAVTRRYHGLLVAALPTPFGRTVMLNYLWEQLRFRDGRVVPLPQIVEHRGGREFDCSPVSRAFRLEAGLPVWEYDVEGVRFEKRVLMPHLQNTTHVSYRAAVDRARPPGAAAADRVPAARGAGQPSAVGAVRRARARRSVRGPAGRRPAAAAPVSRRAREGVHGHPRTLLVAELRARAAPRLRMLRRPLEPGLLPADADARHAGHARRLDRIVGDDRRADAAGSAARRAPPPRAARRGGDGHVPRRDGRGAGARRRPVHHHARRPRRRGGAGARHGRRSADGRSPATTGSPIGAATR